jgi:addiction module HigA family antidote
LANIAFGSTINGESVLLGGKVTRGKSRLSIITVRGETMTREVPLIHPGEILFKDWLEPLGISQYALAKAINVPRRRINEIVLGQRAITADTATRLGVFFGVEAEGWLALQAHYDAELARQRISDVLAIIPRYDSLGING